MAHPIIIQASVFRNYLSAFQGVIRPAQWTYFVTVLMGLIHCQASRTLSGILRSVATWVTVWQLSRFLVSPRWTTTQLAEVRFQVFTAEMQPLVEASHAEQCGQRVKRPGRYPATVVTGYLILDDCHFSSDNVPGDFTHSLPPFFTQTLPALCGQRLPI